MHAIGALSTGILFKELKMEKQRKLSHDNYSLDPNGFLTFFYDSRFKGPVQVYAVTNNFASHVTCQQHCPTVSKLCI